MLTRRQFVTAAGALASLSCAREKGIGFEGHAFVANEEGGAIAAVNLTAFAVTRHIRIEGRPTKVVSHPVLPSVWALASGYLHEIDPTRLEFRRKIPVGGPALDLQLSPDGAHLWILSPGRLSKLAAETLAPAGTWTFPGAATSFVLARREPWAAVTRKDAPPLLLPVAEPGRVTPIKLPYQADLAHFRSDGNQLMLAGSAARLASFVTVPDGRTVAHLPLAIEPRRIASKPDGGELYLTGDGLDAVVVLYPYLAEVGETVLAGRRPAAMAAVSTPDMAYLFVANPEAGNVTILDITTHKMVGAVPVGKDPSFVTITPDGQYALVLNRASGDMGVIRVKAVVRNRGKSAPLFTMIPVGSRPVAAAVRGV
ncbi:MAG: YncE family protein [Bryobacteraceae bacterium]